MEAQAYDFGGALGAGFEGMFEDGRGYQLAVVPLADILIDKQIREEMEDEDSTLDDMEGSVKKHGILQTLLLRPIPGPIPYKLVAGERRYRGAQRAGESEVPAMIKEMTDEEADDIQLAENIHRKNLTQIEEAKKIQKDLDKLGSVEAVLAKHNKGRAWLSKILSLLSLPEQAKRLVSEQISADVEVIGMVKTVEKIDPVAAKELVDDLKKTRGKVDARKVAEKAKDAVKPPTKAKAQKQGDKATPKDQAHKEPGRATVLSFAGAKMDSETLGPAPAWPFPGSGEDAEVQSEAAGRPALTPDALERAYGLIFESGSSAKMFLDTLSKQDRVDLAAWLESFYNAGHNAKNVAQGVIQGLRKGTFATEGAGAYAMLAFLQGADAAVTHFNVQNVLGLAKA